MDFLTPTFVPHGFENVSFFHDRVTGLKSIISIHNTQLGPSLGGCRYYPYVNSEAALKDVMRLSEAMTYKAAMADLPLGGGKAVILGNPTTEKTPEKLSAFAGFVNRLGGAYITTVDSGTTSADMAIIHGKTKHVVGMPNVEGGSDDPSPNTALGVFEGIKASLAFHFGTPELKGRKIAIQGIGNVGLRLAKLLHAAGASLALADVNEEKLSKVCSELGAESHSTVDILKISCDVVAPCAMGGAIDVTAAENLQAPIIAGAANNQLADETVSALLKDRGILYAPDFVINGGGLIHVTLDLNILTPKQVEEKTLAIFQTLTTIFDRAQKSGQPTEVVAIEMAKEKIA